MEGGKKRKKKNQRKGKEIGAGRRIRHRGKEIRRASKSVG